MAVEKRIMDTLSSLTQAIRKLRNIHAEIAGDRLDTKEVIFARIDRVQALLDEAKEAIGEER